MKKLPVSMSTFSEMIEDGYVYVDKTQHIYNMTTTGKTYFLSRPRRFGKSLLVKTLKELFKGNKNLFKDLYIYDKWNWDEKYPVIHLDFGSRTSKTPEQLELSLNKFLNDTAIDHDVELENQNLLADKFEELIKKIYKKAKQKVVVLIDEYDMPIIDSISNIEIANSNRDILRDFYKVLKTNDDYLRFVFLTGVSKFSKTSVFSGLNNLDDITVSPDFSTICGYTQEELEKYFRDYIDKFSKNKHISRAYLLDLIKQWYDGYSWDGENFLYNPFSILLLFKNEIFKNYWFESGTPSFLMDIIEKDPANNMDILFNNDLTISDDFPSFDLEYIDFTTVLLQTGYLTIKSANIVVGKLPKYKLGIPNQEVNNSLFTSIIRKFTAEKNSENIRTLAEQILEAIRDVNNESLQKCFDVLMNIVPAVLYGKVKEDIREANYHIWFLTWFKLMGFFVLAEIPSSKGTADIIFKLNDLVLVSELKYDTEKDLEDLSLEAINQIKEKEYYKPYLDNEVILLGIGLGNRQLKSTIERLK